MSIDTKVVIVKDVEYSITTIDTEKSYELFLRLSKHLSGPLEAATKSIFKGDDDSMDALFISNIASMLTSIDPKELVALTKDLLESNTKLIKESRMLRMADFKGDLSTMLQVTMEVIKHNYKDFFSGIANMLKATLGSKMKLPGEGKNQQE